MKSLFVFIILTFVHSCQDAVESTPFEREKELFGYFDCANLKSPEKLNHVFIFQTNKCGACTDEVMDYLETNFKNNEELKTFIVSSNHKQLIEVLRKFKNAKIHIDVNTDLEKYGLSYANDLYFRINSSKVEIWSFLNHQTIKKLPKRNS